MTANVLNVLEKIKDSHVFDNEIYFVGGTALAYYLNHRVSEDIDIVSAQTLQHKEITSSMISLGAVKLQDENITALRMAGLFPDDYMVKFVLNNVKVEFFQANRAIQKEILSHATFNNFENSKLKILDVKSIAKLKIVALVLREKSRDLFDFGAILEHQILSHDEIITLFTKINSQITSLAGIVKFINVKNEPSDDEAVYINETKRVDLNFDEIKGYVNRKLIEYI